MRALEAKEIVETMGLEGIERGGEATGELENSVEVLAALDGVQSRVDIV